jgi:hypothetical protein
MSLIPETLKVEAGGLQVKASSYKVSKILSQKQNKNKRA